MENSYATPQSNVVERSGNISLYSPRQNMPGMPLGGAILTLGPLVVLPIPAAEVAYQELHTC